MYNELIDALQCTRHFALYQDCYEKNCYANSGKGLYCNIPKLMADAADAIEHLKENVAHQQDAIERLQSDLDKKNRIIKVMAKKVGQLIDIVNKENHDDSNRTD